MYNIKMSCPAAKSSLRKRADKAKKLRSRSLIAVLEEPSNIANIGAVLRCIDSFGINKLYIISSEKYSSYDWKGCNKLKALSASASKWVYIKHFNTTSQCLSYLAKNRVTSMVTSPHHKVDNIFPLETTDFTRYKRLAVWFGNESKGISQEAALNSIGSIKIQMCGIVESINLGVAAGTVLHWIAHQRREHKRLKHSK